jgi:class 3 adenylate cyclase
MEEVNRRLAGILAADVVGYSAKMGADDADTLARVRTLRTAVIEPLAATTVGACSNPWATGFWWSSPARCRHCAVPSPSSLP